MDPHPRVTLLLLLEESAICGPFERRHMNPSRRAISVLSRHEAMQPHVNPIGLRRARTMKQERKSPLLHTVDRVHSSEPPRCHGDDQVTCWSLVTLKGGI